MSVSHISDRIDVGAVIGSGAMGVLLSGKRRTDGRPVAVKLLLPKHIADTDIAGRFVLEGKALSELKSPYLPEVIEVGVTASHQPYIVMELLEGRDMEAVLADPGSIPVGEVAAYVIEACEAVAVAHAAHIVHRDIKPSNLFLATLPDGTKRVKLLDFGIAKLGLVRAEGRRTSGSIVMGTSHYTSPEQVRCAAEVDYRSDIWSLGVVLFELLTRRLPFDGPTPMAVMNAILDQPTPRFASMFGEVPHDLVRVVSRCLEKDPARRFGSVSELADALRPFVRTPATFGPLFVLPDRASKPPPSHTQRIPRETLVEQAPPSEPEGEDEWFAAIAAARRKLA